MKKTFLTLLLLLCLILPVSSAAHAQEDTFTGTFTTLGHDVSWDFVYRDDFFFQTPDQYDHDLARLSLGLALSAFRDTPHPEAQDGYLISFLESMGFEQIETEVYRTDPTPDSICYGIARKQIDDMSLTVCAVCGGNYGKEWASNLTIGDDVRSAGFQDAAGKVEAALADYMERHPADGGSRLWITGFSRAAAVSNLTAADCTDSGLFDAVYAYTFATPRTTREPEGYPNIFNIIQKEDMVPKVPLADWGYGRYGTDMFLVSGETDYESSPVIEQAGALYREMIGSEMVVNPEINDTLRIVMDYLLMLFPDPAAYTESLQPLLVDIMVGSDGENTKGALQILLEALQNYGTEDPQQQKELRSMLDYLETLINQYYLRDGLEKQAADKWDPQFGTTNLFNDHFPFEYLAMMYASDDPAELFSGKMEYIRLVIDGKVDVTVSDGDTVLKTVQAGDPEMAGGKAVITLPADRSLSVTVQSKAFLPQTVTYTGLLLSNQTFRAKVDNLYSFIMKRGETGHFHTSSDGAIVPEGSDHTDITSAVEKIYSPTTAMRLENNDVVKLTVSGFVNKLLFILVFLLVQMIASIILTVIRKKKHRQRNSAVACVWHAVVALVFAMLELAMWYFIPVLPIAKIICGLMVCVVIFIYAHKGYRLHDKEKKKTFLIHLVCLAVFFVLQNLLLGSFTTLKGLIVLIGYIIFFNASFFLLWHRKKQKEEVPAM